jgi:Transglycosylase SLT domain
VKKSLKPLHAPPPKLSSPMKSAMRTAAHGIALGALLVSGAVWTISQQHPLYANPGKLLRLPAAVVDASQPTEQAFRIGEVLNQYTHDRGLAFRIADAIVEQGQREKIDPALLVGVLLTEDATLDPRARSSVGARGLMQVMPLRRTCSTWRSTSATACRFSRRPLTVRPTRASRCFATTAA